MKIIPREKLIIRDAFKLYYGGGAIWAIELDHLSIYTDIVREKFSRDVDAIGNPSAVSTISVNLYETLIDDETAQFIVEKLADIHRPIKIAFVGVNLKGIRLFTAHIKKYKCCPFQYGYFLDWEEAKKWLVLGE